MMEKWEKMDSNNEGRGIVGVGDAKKAHGGNLRARLTTHPILFKPTCLCLRKPIKLKREAHPCFFSSITHRGPVSINYRVRAQLTDESTLSVGQEGDWPVK